MVKIMVSAFIIGSASFIISIVAFSNAFHNEQEVTQFVFEDLNKYLQNDIFQNKNSGFSFSKDFNINIDHSDQDQINNKKISEYIFSDSIEAKQLTDLEIQSTALNLVIKQSNDPQLHYKITCQTCNEDSVIKFQGENTFKLSVAEHDANQNDSTQIQIDSSKNSLSISISESDNKIEIYIPSNIKNVKFKTISGDLLVTEVNLDNLSFNSTSGNSEVMSKINNIEAQTVSGDLTILNLTDPYTISAKTVSGDLTISKQMTHNSQIIFNTVSGEFTTESGDTLSDTNQINIRKGTASSKIDFKSTSGDLIEE